MFRLYVFVRECHQQVAFLSLEQGTDVCPHHDLSWFRPLASRSGPYRFVRSDAWRFVRCRQLICGAY